MTDYLLKEDVLGIIKAGIDSCKDLIKREINIYHRTCSTKMTRIKARISELENLYLIFNNRESFEFD